MCVLSALCVCVCVLCVVCVYCIWHLVCVWVCGCFALVFGACVLPVDVHVYVCVSTCYMQFVCPRARAHIFLFVSVDCCVLLQYFNSVFYFVVSYENVCVCVCVCARAHRA